MWLAEPRSCRAWVVKLADSAGAKNIGWPLTFPTAGGQRAEPGRAQDGGRSAAPHRHRRQQVPATQLLQVGLGGTGNGGRWAVWCSAQQRGSWGRRPAAPADADGMIGSRFWCVQQTVVAGHTTAAGTLPFKLTRPCWLLSAPVDFFVACQSHCRIIGREKPEVWISDPTRSVVLQVGVVLCYLGTWAGEARSQLGPATSSRPCCYRLSRRNHALHVYSARRMQHTHPPCLPFQSPAGARRPAHHPLQPVCVGLLAALPAHRAHQVRRREG